MNEIVKYRNLYDDLYNALKHAGDEEAEQLRLATNSRVNEAARYKHNILNTVAIVELREYMQQLITLLAIELPRAFQGKRIQTFTDAAAIISDCRIQIITKMERHEDDDSYACIVTNIINCCEEVGSIGEF